MQYINPIEILQLSHISDSSQIDSDVIKRAKRKLYADIELSDDGHLAYYRMQLTKGDCERAINELSDNDLKEFHLYLASNKPLNTFLITGDNTVFYNFRIDSIFKHPAFVSFVSPYFSQKLDKVLLNAFEAGNVEELRLIFKTTFLVSQNDINTAYKGIAAALQDRIAGIASIKADIKNRESIYSEFDISEVRYVVAGHFPSAVMNCLPNYFQSQILKVANEINQLNVVIWEHFDNNQVCEDLLQHILTLSIDGLNKPVFEKNYGIVKRKNQERAEQERVAPIFNKYAAYLVQVNGKLDEIGKKQLAPVSVMNWVNSTISISEVNGLPKSLDEIRNQVALSLRALSVSIWNAWSNLEVSWDLITKANSITGLAPETLQNIRDGHAQLSNLKKKIEMANQPRREPPKPLPVMLPAVPVKTSSNSDDSSFGFWALAILIIGTIIIILIAQQSKKTTYTRPSYSYDPPASAVPGSQVYTPETSSSNSYTPDNSLNSSATALPDPTYEPPVASIYKGNQLNNGASPLNTCFGEGSITGQAYITFENSNKSDAIVCLVELITQKTTRNEYIKAGASYTMRGIPGGTYYLKVYYGNDWNPSKVNFCGGNGAFESNVHFSKSDGPGDLLRIENDEFSYTTGRVTLYSVADGNMTTQPIGESEFFNQ